MILEYRFGMHSYVDTQQAIKQQAEGELRQTMLASLQVAKSFRLTKLTPEERRELQLYRQAIQVFYDNHQSGFSSCQGFVNSIEYYLSGHGYHQVIGIDKELEWNADDISPVLCWDQPEQRARYQTAFLHQLSSDAFRLAIHSGEQWQSNDAVDSTELLNGERYLLLRTMPSGDGGGHFVNMVRSKASGRFIVIDGQKLNIFPVIHNNGDFTDEAYKELANKNVYVLRMDLISYETLEQAFRDSTALLKQHR